MSYDIEAANYWSLTEKELRKRPSNKDYRETQSILHDFGIKAEVPQTFQTKTQLNSWKREQIEKRLSKTEVARWK